MLHDLLLSNSLFRFGDVVSTSELDHLKLFFQLTQSLFSHLFTPEMKRYVLSASLTVILVKVVFERLDYQASLVLLFHLKTDGELKWQIVLFYFSTWNQFDVFAQNWFGNHCIFCLHQSEGWVFESAVKVSIEVVVVFEKVN